MIWKAHFVLAQLKCSPARHARSRHDHRRPGRSPRQEAHRHAAIELERRHGARNYDPLPVVLERGEDVWLFDTAGRRYLDMMSAYSAVSFGHSPPDAGPRAWSSRRRRSPSPAAPSTPTGSAASSSALCRMTGMDRALPMNTGAEAVETAIKAARKWAYKVKGVPARPRRDPRGRGQLRRPHHDHRRLLERAAVPRRLRPVHARLPSACRSATPRRSRRRSAPNTAAFIVEPVQGEAGIIVPPVGYLRAVREICTRQQRPA